MYINHCGSLCPASLTTTELGTTIMPTHSNMLALKSSLRNPNFASWKLDPENQLQCTPHPLPSMVMPATTYDETPLVSIHTSSLQSIPNVHAQCTPCSTGTDYAHARVAALANSLMRAGNNLYTIVRTSDGTWQLCCIHVGLEELRISIAIGVWGVGR